MPCHDATPRSEAASDVILSLDESTPSRIKAAAPEDRSAVKLTSSVLSYSVMVKPSPASHGMPLSLAGLCSVHVALNALIACSFTISH